MTSLISLMSLSPAFALDHEVTLETGYLKNEGPAFNLFSESNRMNAVGIRAVGALGEHLGIVGSWQHTGQKAEINVGQYTEADEDSDFDYGPQTQTYQSELQADQFSLGPIADWEIFNGALAPYVHADMIVQRATAHLRSGIENYPNRVELERTALQAGVAAMVGITVNVPIIAGSEVTGHVEVGTTQYLGSLKFQDFGEMQPGGFTLRTGIGLRY